MAATVRLDVKLQNDIEKNQNIAINDCFDTLENTIDSFEAKTTTQNYKVNETDNHTDFIIGIDSTGNLYKIGNSTYAYGDESTFSVVTSSGAETTTTYDSDVSGAQDLIDNEELYSKVDTNCSGYITYEVDSSLYAKLQNYNFGCVTLNGNNSITINCNGYSDENKVETVSLIQTDIKEYYWDTMSKSTGGAGSSSYHNPTATSWSPSLTYYALTYSASLLVGLGTQYGPFETLEEYTEWFNTIDPTKYTVAAPLLIYNQQSSILNTYRFTKHYIETTKYSLKIVSTKKSKVSNLTCYKIERR